MTQKFFLFICALVLLTVIPVAFVSKSRTIQNFMATYFPAPTPKHFVITGVGVIGDSQSDEYQADDHRGYQYAPTTLGWVEQLVKNRKIDFGPWNTWGDSRRTGFGYNWAQTGATSQSMISSGQHTGLVQQVKDGTVNLVIIYIGANDFAPYNTIDGYYPVYSGALAGKELMLKENKLVDAIETVIMTIREAGKTNIVVVTVPDWSLSGIFRVAYPDTSGQQRVSNAVTGVNTKLKLIAKKYAVALADINVFYKQYLTEAPLGSIRIGSEDITLLVPSDEPHSAFLSDGIHPGTVVSGLFARFLIQQINQSFGATIAPLTDEEILQNAGLGQFQ
jgi:phospholipase/lecithinase/hemolysin